MCGSSGDGPVKKIATSLAFAAALASGASAQNQESSGTAGRSPSYLVCQLNDFQHGQRAGPGTPFVAGAVAKLNVDDFVSLAAYASSLAP
jgi:cytochrome c553